MSKGLQNQEVLVTGLGPISTFGMGIDPLWSALIEGRTGIAPLSSFDASNFDCGWGAALAPEDFNVRDCVPKAHRKATKVMARDIELAVGASAIAVADAGLVTRGTSVDETPSLKPERVGCHIGAGLIPAEINELARALVTSLDGNGAFDLGAWGERGMGNLSPLWLLKYLPNMLACHVTIVHDCQGPSNTITCAESSSGLSFAESMRVINRNAADLCLSGGAESKLNLVGLLRHQFAGRFGPAGQLEEANCVIHPYSENACGTVVGEGGGILVLESADSAAARGVEAKAILAGFAASQSIKMGVSGAYCAPTDPALTSAIKNALRAARCTPGEVDAIVPMGIGVPSQDFADRTAIEGVFGDRAASIPLVTFVPNTGLCGAGHGALAASIAIRSLVEQTLPARIGPAGSATPGLDAAPIDAREATLRNVLVFSSSLGGQNVALLFKRARTQS